MSANIENRIHFGIPIFEFWLADFGQYQQALIKHIHSLHQQDAGVVRSNQGGWHSNDQLHTDSNPAIQWLMQQLYTISSQCIKHHEQDSSIQDIHLVNCWANINWQGHWNAPHHHYPQDWSGVVYLNDDTPQTEKTQAIQDGDIVFFDPVPANWSKNRAPTINYPAEAGKVLLFPAYLLHMVAPHYSEQARLSMAFNFKLQY